MAVLLSGCGRTEMDMNSSKNNDPSILSGSFIQPWLFADWTSQDWQQELGYMKDVQMDHIILNWTVKSDDNTTYYPSELGFEQITKDDQVLLALKSAKEAGLKVWLGLNITNVWWKKGAEDEKWLKNEFGLGRKIAGELWALYGGEYSQTIAGFYIPLEMFNTGLRNKLLQDRMAAVYKDICDYVHAETGKAVMVAPFWVYKQPGPKEYAAAWAHILETAAIDVIAMQDGIGCARGNTETVRPWFAAMKEAVEKSGQKTQLWSDLETMHQLVPDVPNPEFVPADIERIKKQIVAERDLVEKFTSFSFNHYQSPKQRDQKGFDAYKAYVDKVMAD